jgi:hypothetical protein
MLRNEAFARPFCLSLVAMCLASAALAGDEAVRMTADQYLAHIKYLADDERGGRYPGKPGIEAAAEYIAEQFKQAGLKPGGDDGTYFQSFEVKSIRNLNDDKAHISVSGMDRPWVIHEDFVPYPFTQSGGAKGQLAFAGYGISSEDYKYDDYADFDASGKVLMILRNEPKDDDPEAKFGGDSPSVHSLFVRKARAARDHGAVGLLIVNPPNRYADSDELYDWDSGSRGAYVLPMMNITQKTANQILRHANMPTLAVLQAELDAGRESLSTDLVGLTVTLDSGLQPVNTRNVVALLEGNGQTDEYIAIGAHYDHVGVLGRGEQSQIHNGADDNASGTAGIIELARVMAASTKLRRNVLFIAFSAEEAGLLGSAHYAEHPTIPLDKIKAMMNFDMIGRLSQEKLTIWGIPTAVEFEQVVKQAAEPLELKYDAPMTTSGIFMRSDHYNFYKHDIPVVFPFTGLHKDYHKPGDDWELIDAPGGVTVLRFAKTMLSELANMESGPTFVSAEEIKAKQAARDAAAGEPTGDSKDAAAGDSHASGGEATDMTSGMPRVRLGIMPAFDDVGEGLGIEEVVPGGAAEQGGVKAGDRILSIAGKDVADIDGYMTALRGFKPGDEAEIVILRSGEKQTLKIKFAGATDRDHGAGDD